MARASTPSGKRKPADDRALILACRRGDQGAWETLVRRYRRLVYSVPVAYRLAEGDADEIFQRVWVKAFEHLDRLRRAESLPAWLLVTARRECQAWVRGARRLDSLDDEIERPLTEDPPDVAGALFRTACEHTLAVAFERLDRTCWELLSALYREDPAPSYDELSRRLDRPVGSLGPTRGRCLKKLQKIYLDLGGEEPW